MRVHLFDLGSGVSELQLLDAVIDLLLTHGRLRLGLLAALQAAVHETRVLTVEPEGDGGREVRHTAPGQTALQAAVHETRVLRVEPVRRTEGEIRCRTETQTE